MKILLLHPEDDPEKGPWVAMTWGRVVDIGLGGVNSYERWSSKFRCPVTKLGSLRKGFDDLRQVRDVLALGCGRLMDEHGLDWWEILSIDLTEEMQALIVLQRLAKTVGTDDEVYVSRPGLHASLLQELPGVRTKVFPLRRNGRKGGLAHYVRVYKKLSATQIVDVVCDKYDVGYQLRGRLLQKRTTTSLSSVVLLPTAYVNVSRTAIAYADTFPQENFLLVAARRSGWLQDLPPNVAGAWLSSYASLRDRSDEIADMESRWRSLLKELEGVTEIDILRRIGYLDNFPSRFRRGFAMRDAWRNVFDTQPVTGVLCADDSNFYTRIPLLLAQPRGLPNIACHHGALDGNYFFKRTYGGVIWAKGKMEQDYLVRCCGVPRKRVEIGAPALPVHRKKLECTNSSTSTSHLLFISEASDACGGRPEEFYRDTLPALADLALGTGRELIVKLHPAESEAERTSMVARVLSAGQKKVTRVVSGPVTEDLLAKAWFGITILSTVAIECAIRGIPCFLCTWLEFLPFGYVEQFVRFGAGITLNDPSEIRRIPEYLQRYSGSATTNENWWRPVDAGRLRKLLESSRKSFAMTAH